MSMGLDPDDCRLIQLSHYGRDVDMPALHFRKRGAPEITVVVEANGEFEHGPVLI
jgi:hypothetical protein